jgi:hypothetical protein
MLPNADTAHLREFELDLYVAAHAATVKLTCRECTIFTQIQDLFAMNVNGIRKLLGMTKLIILLMQITPPPPPSSTSI